MNAPAAIAVPAAGPALRRWDEAVGAAFDRLFPAACNPWRHLGALAFLFLVACVASGVYLFIVFDTSLPGAYESGRALDAGIVGRLARGLHRYSADAFVLATALHLLREAARGHFRAFRAWAWWTGLALVPLAWIAGLTGFWLAWDERALYSAVATAEWIAAWPWQAAAFARNFTGAEAMNDRFFSLVVFVHIGVPLLGLAFTWAHVARLAHVRAWPPRALTAGSLAALAALALAHPAASEAPADFLAVPARVSLDWFYHLPHVLAESLGGGPLWATLGVATALLVALPWMGRAKPQPAVVTLEHCNGCARCAADCPFGAVVMVPRTDGRGHARQASVVPDLCAACGICAGACPSSTPFRRAAPVHTGIDLPDRTISTLRGELDAALAARAAPVVVFACDCAGAAAPAGAVTLRPACTAMVPPSFIDYALRHGAAGVVLAGCREGDCEYRRGDEWTRMRLARERVPPLRAVVPRSRVASVACGQDAAALARAIETVRRPPEASHA